MLGSVRGGLMATGALAVLAAGCGGSSSGGGGGGGGGGGDGSPKSVFASTCGSCHTLKAAGTSGSVGPNLDELKPDAALVESAIRTGPSLMPSNLLKGPQARSVAQYVADNAGK